MSTKDGKTSLTLPPRLRRESEFRHVTRNGERRRQGFLTIYISPAMEVNTGGKSGRVGFVITMKAVKSAVKRNRLRRLLREAVRKWWWGIQDGYDIVLRISGYPEIDHGEYVEKKFVKICLDSKLFTERGMKKAEEFLATGGKSG